MHLEWQTRVVTRSRIGRLQHRHSGGDGVAAVVLFVLAGGHAGIVRADDHQPARRAGVGDGEQRVGGHVESDVLHRHQRPAVGEGRADGDFERRLLVGRPLRTAALLVELIENFRRRSTGIPGPEVDAAVEGGHCDGFVAARQNSFRHTVSPVLFAAGKAEKPALRRILISLLQRWRRVPRSAPPDRRPAVRPFRSADPVPFHPA